MNLFNIIFLFLIGLQHVYCGDGLKRHCLPPEINSLIVAYMSPVFNDLPVRKVKGVLDSVQSLHFPSTASFQFIQAPSNNEVNLKLSDLTSISMNSLVLPSIHLDVRSVGDAELSANISADNYDLGIFLEKEIFFTNCVMRQLLFDVKGDRVVYYIQYRSRFCDLNKIISPSYTRGRSFDNREILCSLCVHDPDTNEFSIITLESNNEKDNKKAIKKNYIKINSFSAFEKEEERYKDIEPERKFEIPLSIETIKKHEYIGNNLFLLHCDENLFFCTEQENGTLNIALQSFFDSKAKQDTNRYSVISFCVNHDVKTSSGKAPHFFLLALKDGKYVILHVDLLNTYNIIRKIWSFEQQDDVERGGDDDPAVVFDRIAFNKEGFCLWKDDEFHVLNDGKPFVHDIIMYRSTKETRAMSIRFEPGWMNVFENQSLFQAFYKNPDQENKKNIVLYEGILNEQTDTTPKKNTFYNKIKIISFLLLSSLFIVFSLCKKLKPIRFFY